jgi:hypothetical protein
MPRCCGVAKASVTVDLVSPSQGCEKGPKISPRMCLFSTCVRERTLMRRIADKIAQTRAFRGSFKGQAFQ